METAEDSWTNVYDLMDLDALAASSDDYYVGKLGELVREIRREGLGFMKSPHPPSD